MSFRRYLRGLGALHFQGVTSNFSPGLLRRLGGALTLASTDAMNVRVEEDAYLGFIDANRSIQERWDMGHQTWRRHRGAIIAQIRNGKPPTRAVHDYMRSQGTYPHTPAQVDQMLQQNMLGDGSVAPGWMIPTIRFRRRLERGANVMGDTFGALATMVALAITADNFAHATPEEWDRAMNAGEVAILLGNMAGAHTDAGQTRRDTHRDASRPVR